MSALQTEMGNGWIGDLPRSTAVKTLPSISVILLRTARDLQKWTHQTRNIGVLLFTAVPWLRSVNIACQELWPSWERSMSEAKFGLSLYTWLWLTVMVILASFATVKLVTF